MATADWGACTLSECSIKQSIFQYRPSLAANGVFIALFGLSLVIHGFQGLLYRQWTFGTLMVLGCACEMIGYGGRIMMYEDPWNFTGFIMQIVCITIAPVFMTAAIYVTLYKSILKLSPASARFRPSLYYLIFIPCDIISLVLQAAGGAMSTQSGGTSGIGVDVGLAGLSFQVFTLLVFISLAVDYAMRYRRGAHGSRLGLDGRFKLFLLFLSFAMLVILIRCVYRIYELSDGYHGPALHDEGLFIALESCMITLAVFALNIGHPGQVFRGSKAAAVDDLSDETIADAEKE